jgi:predicted N-acetyltransferase YhbS
MERKERLYLEIELRSENSSDFTEVYRVNQIAFGGRDDEAQLVERIRESEGYVPELSIVAVLEERIVGHLLISKAEVVHDDTIHEVLALAPIAVLPEYQKSGVGTRLMTEGIVRSRSLGASLICLIGHPSYYPKFGFTPARPHGLDLKQFEVPDDVFMVRELQADALRSIQGELRYPAAFFT